MDVPRGLPRRAVRTSGGGVDHLPLDVAGQEIDYEPRVGRPLPVAAPEPAPEQIRLALEMLLDAQRPLIMSGGGVILGEASDELRALAEYLQIPVTITLMGKGSSDRRQTCAS